MSTTIEKFIFICTIGLWRTALLYRGHWILFVSCFIAACLPFLLLAPLKSFYSERETNETCASSRPVSLSNLGIHPFLDEIICGSNVGCNLEDNGISQLAYPPITERFPNDEELLDFTQENSPSSVLRKLNKNLAQLEKFVKKLKRQPTLNDVISTSYNLKTSVTDYQRLLLVTEERLNINLTEATECVLTKLTLKQILSGIPKDLGEYFIFDARTLGKFMTLSDEVTYNLNNLTSFKYDRMKSIYEAIYDHLDWRRIYQKVYQLRAYSLETKLTSKHIQSIQEMIQSFSRLENLRSLLGIFYSAKIFLETSAEAKRTLSDTGWTDREIAGLLSDFLELNEEGIIEKTFQLSKRKPLKTRENTIWGSLSYCLLRNIRINLSNISCSSDRVSIPKNAYDAFIFAKELRSLINESEMNGTVTVANLLQLIFLTLEKFKQPNSEDRILVDICESGPILREFLDALHILDLRKVVDTFVEFIATSSDLEQEKLEQVIHKLSKVVFTNAKNSGNLEESPNTRLKKVLKYISIYWSQQFIAIRKIFPDSSAVADDNEYLQHLIGHPFLLLKPSNAVQIIGDIITTKITDCLLSPKVKLDEYCEDNTTDLAKDLQCSVKDGFGQRLTSPFFDNLLKSPGNSSELPSSTNLLKNFIVTHHFVQKYNRLEGIPLHEIKQFLEIWSSKKQWEDLEEDLNLYHQTWVYSFLDSFIPLWSKPTTRMLNKLTDLAAYIELFEEDLQKFLVAEQGIISEALSHFYNMNGTWEIGLHLIYDHVKDRGEVQRGSDVCELDSELALVENVTLMEYEAAVTKICSINMEPIAEAVRLFDKYFDKKIREQLTPTGTFHMKSLVTHSQKAYENWVNLHKMLSYHDSSTLFKFLFEPIQEIIEVGVNEGSNVNTNIKFIQSLLEILKFEKTSAKVQKKFSPEFLQKTNLLRQLFATDVEDLLHGTPELYNFQDVALNVVPHALRECVVFVSTKPRMMSALHPFFIGNATACEIDLSIIGENAEKVQGYFCNFPTDTLAFEIEKLMTVNAFKKSYNEKTNSATLKLLNQTMANLQKNTATSTDDDDASNATQIFDFSKWNKIFDTILNVSVDEIYENGAMIWSQTMLPLVTESRSGKPKSEKLKDILLVIDGFLRQVKFGLGLLAGGDLWTSFKNSYEDKNYIIQLIDSLEKSPQIITHILEYYGDHPTFLYELLQLKDFQDFCSFLSILSEERDLDQPDQWKELFKFICTQESRDIILNQLHPGTLPIIGNQTVMESDAAVIGLLLDGVSWDLFLLQRKYFFEGNIQVPDWMRPFHWTKVKELVFKIVERRFSDHLILSFLIKEKHENKVKAREGDAKLSHPLVKIKKIGTIISQWIDELVGTNDSTSIFENININNILNLAVLTTESEVMHNFLIGDSMEDILKYTCHRQNLSNASHFLCSLIRVCYFDLYEIPDQDATNDQRETIEYLNLSDKIQKLLKEFSNTNISDEMIQERIYKVFKILVFTYQQLYVSHCSDIDRCIFQMKVITQVMKYVSYLDTMPFTADNSSSDIVKEAMNRILKSFATKKKGGKWANSEEELLKLSHDFHQQFDEFFISLVKIVKYVMNLQTMGSVSSIHLKLLGILEVLAETFWKLKSDQSLQNLIVEFTYEIQANEKSLSFLSELVNAKPISNLDKNGFLFVRQILRKEIPIKLLKNTTEELDGIITALLFFNEAVDIALFDELNSANYSVGKISEGKLFVLRSLSESSLQMLRISTEYIPGSKLHNHLLKIKAGLDILLHKEELTEALKKNVLQDMTFNNVTFRRKLKALELSDNLIDTLLSAEVDLNLFQAVVDKWYHTVSTACDQLTTSKNSTAEVDSCTDSKVTAICIKLRNIDFPLLLLSQLNLSSLFYQVENFTLQELFNSSSDTPSMIQDIYVMSLYLTDHLIQIQNSLLSLSKISGVNKLQGEVGSLAKIVDPKSILYNLKEQICSLGKNEFSRNDNGDDFEDLCSSLILDKSGDISVREESLLHGRILVTPDTHLTRSLINLVNRSFGENIDRALTLLHNIKQYLKEECKPSLQKMLLNLLSEIQLHDWAQSPVESVLSVDLNQMRIMVEHIMQYCKTIDTNKQELEKIIDFVRNFISCFKKKRFELASLVEFQKKSEELIRENRLIAGIDFSDVSKQELQRNSESLAYNLKLPSVENVTLINFKKRLWRNSFDNPAETKAVQKEIAVIQSLIEDSLRKLLSYKEKETPSEISNSNSRNHSLSRRNAETAKTLPFEPSRKKHQPYQPRNPNENAFSIHAVGASFRCPVQNQRYYDSIIDSPTMGSFICFTAFLLFGIFLINVFVEEAQSISLELKRVYSINYVSSITFPLTFAFLLLAVMTCIIAILLKALNVLPQASGFVIAAIIFIFGASLIILSHILSAILSKMASTISLVAILTVMAVYYVLLMALGRKPSPLELIMMSFLPPCGFSYGIRFLHQYEKLGIGASFSNLWILPSDDDEISLALVLIIQLFGFFILCFIDVLVIVVFKKDSIVDSGDKFLSFKIGQQNVQRETARTAGNETFAIFQDQSYPNLTVHSTLSGSFVRSLKVVGLQKLIFDGVKTIIIGENISFEAYENQIFVLYGPRKSGKTTVISMVAGVLQPSSGHISIYGESPRALKKNLQKIVSFCPKDSKLPSLMTVKECLTFFGYVKAIKSYKEVKKEVESLIRELKLECWQNELLRDIPEGIRKYVAVTSALIGDPKIVALDEPTHQVPHSLRRNLFAVLSKYRKERTILITSGDPDIVEQLADVISVIDKGKLLFIGPKKVLMEEFSPGYDVIINNRQDVRPIPQQEVLEELLEELFQEYFPNASFMDFENEDQQVKFNIPCIVAQLHPESFCYLLRDLEVRREELGVSYVDVTHPSTMMILKAVLQQGDTFRHEALLTPEREEIHRRNFNFGNTSNPSQFRRKVLIFGALLNKRMLHNIRNKIFYLQVLFAPVLLIILSMLCLWIPQQENTGTGLEMSSSYINHGIYLLSRNLTTPAQRNDLENRLENFLLKYDLAKEGKIVDEEICEKQKIQKNILSKNKFSCYLAAEKLNYTSCVCRDKQCLMKGTLANKYSVFIPFNKRHFRILPPEIFDETFLIREKMIVLFFDQNDVSSLPLMASTLSKIRREEVTSNWTIVPSVEFTSPDDLNFKEFTLGHHLATMLFGLLLLTALTIGIVTSSMQVIGEKNQLSMMMAAGVSKLLYLCSFIVWDSLVVALITFLTVMFAAIFYEPHLVAGSHLAALSLLACLYGGSLLPVSYIFQSFFFLDENLAVKIFSGAYITIAVFTTSLVYFCEEFDDIEEIGSIGYYLDWIFLTLPQYAFVSGVKSLYFIHYQNQDVTIAEKGNFYSPFIWNSSVDLHIGAHLIILCAWICSGYAVLLLLEYKYNVLNYWKKIVKNRSQNDTNVDIPPISKEMSLVVTNLEYRSPAQSTKRSKLSFHARRGECLSIVGESSLENTMILQHLTGELNPSGGNVIRVNGERVEDEMTCRSEFSYFPNERALDDFLTTEEELQIFAQLRGFDGINLCEIVHRALCTFNLISVKDFKTKDLLVETKRRISLAKTAIGNPKMIILDDPFRSSSLKFRKLVQEMIRNVVNSSNTVIISSTNFDDVSELTNRLMFYEDGSIVQIGNVIELQASLKRKYLLKIQTQKLEDVKTVIRILEGVQTLQITGLYHTTIEARFSCDVAPFQVFGAISKAREVAPFWYEVSSLNLSQFRRAMEIAGSREPTPDDETAARTSLLNLSNGNASSSVIAFPVFDGRESRDSFYDNHNDDEILPHSKFNLSPRIRRGSHGSAKLTPCSTPLPPRSPAGFRTSFEILPPTDPRRSVDRRSSAEKSTVSESQFKLQMPKKIKRRAGLSMDGKDAPSCSHDPAFGVNESLTVRRDQSEKKKIPNLLTRDSSGSQHIMEKFLENLPNVTTIPEENNRRSPNCKNDERRTQF